MEKLHSQALKQDLDLQRIGSGLHFTMYSPVKNTHNRVVVVGAGGHARVCIELLQQSGYHVVACVGSASTPTVDGTPVLEGDHHLERLKEEGFDQAFVAIGDNHLRVKLSSQCAELGYSLVSAISPTAILSPRVSIGRGVAIMPGAIVNVGTVVGDLAIINTGASVDHDCHIGESVHVAPRCGLAGSVKIGARTLIGIGTSILPGIEIGHDVIIGAGSVVIRNIPSGATAYGAPATTKA